jgi:catechol-2,3-dioxygenase
MTSPAKMSHLVLNTNRLPAMRDWYCKVLGAEIVQENARICFLSYDEEHHRVAFIDPGPLAPRPALKEDGRPVQAGLNHIAFNFATLEELLENYERLKRLGIEPHWCVNHGPTTSIYYRDPDGNGVELEFDNFATLQGCKDFMRSEAFVRDQRGVDFDPDQLIARLRSGVPVAELVIRG